MKGCRVLLSESHLSHTTTHGCEAREDDSLDVYVGLIDEPLQPRCILENELVVRSSNCRVQVAKKQFDNLSLVGVSHRHRLYRC